jgi:hypothetical protein
MGEEHRGTSFEHALLQCLRAQRSALHKSSYARFRKDLRSQRTKRHNRDNRCNEPQKPPNRLPATSAEQRKNRVSESRQNHRRKT